VRSIYAYQTKFVNPMKFCFCFASFTMVVYLRNPTGKKWIYTNIQGVSKKWWGVCTVFFDFIHSEYIFICIYFISTPNIIQFSIIRDCTVTWQMEKKYHFSKLPHQQPAHNQNTRTNNQTEGRFWEKWVDLYDE
jgi:hypothetical protein